MEIGRPDRATAARAALVLLLITEIGLALSWLAQDRRPPLWDPASHGRAALKSGHAIWRTTPPIRAERLPQEMREAAVAHPGLARFALGPVAGPANWIEAFYRHASYPSLPFMVAGALLPISGDTPDALAFAVGTLWFVLAILATYLLAARVFDEWMGLVAAIALAGTPLALGLGRAIMVDDALVATTAAALWALVRCEGFRSRRSSLLLGLLLGLGLLAKQTFVIVLGPAVAWEAFAVLRASRQGELDGELRRHHVQLSFLLAALVAAPWYVAYLPSMLSDPDRLGLVFASLLGESVGPAADRWIYPRMLISSDMGPFAFLMAAVGALILALRRSIASRWALLLGLGTAFLFYTFVFPTKGGRFIAAVLPIAALATAALVDSFRPRVLRLAAGVGVACLAALTTVASTIVDLREDHFPIPLLGGDTRLVSLRTVEAHPPEPEDWGHTRVLEAIRADHGPGPVHVVVIQEGADYKGELMLRATPSQLRWADGLAVDALEIVQHVRKLDEGEPYYLVAALQRPLRPFRATLPGFSWMEDEDRELLERRRELREILRIDGLPRDLQVRVYHEERAGG